MKLVFNHLPMTILATGGAFFEMGIGSLNSDFPLSDLGTISEQLKDAPGKPE